MGAAQLTMRKESHNLNPFVTPVDVDGCILKRERTNIVERVRRWRYSCREGQCGVPHAWRSDQTALFYLDHALAVERFAIGVDPLLETRKSGTIDSEGRFAWQSTVCFRRSFDSRL